jgi:hypothetical protein
MEHEQWTDSGRTELVIILVRRDQQLAARSIRSLGDRHQGTSKKPVSTTIWHNHSVSTTMHWYAITIPPLV